MVLVTLGLQLILHRIIEGNLDRVLHDRADSVVAAVVAAGTGGHLVVPDGRARARGRSCTTTTGASVAGTAWPEARAQMTRLGRRDGAAHAWPSARSTGSTPARSPPLRACGAWSWSASPATPTRRPSSTSCSPACWSACLVVVAVGLIAAGSRRGRWRPWRRWPSGPPTGASTTSAAASSSGPPDQRDLRPRRHPRRPARARRDDDPGRAAAHRRARPRAAHPARRHPGLGRPRAAARRTVGGRPDRPRADRHVLAGDGRDDHDPARARARAPASRPERHLPARRRPGRGGSRWCPTSWSSTTGWPTRPLRLAAPRDLVVRAALAGGGERRAPRPVARCASTPSARRRRWSCGSPTTAPASTRRSARPLFAPGHRGTRRRHRPRARHRPPGGPLDRRRRASSPTDDGRGRLRASGSPAVTAGRCPQLRMRIVRGTPPPRCTSSTSSCSAVSATFCAIGP